MLNYKTNDKIALDYEINNRISYDETIDKKWTFLQYVYKMWSNKEFSNNQIKVIENNENVVHTIYLNLNEREFLLYLYFIDIKEAQLRGKNADCTINFETGDVKLIFYDKLLAQDMEDIINEVNEISFEQIPNFDFKMYFYIPERDIEFYYQLISFIYYLSEVDIPQYGIKICDRKGNFQKYNSLKFPHENLSKFLYYDGNIFIGSHSQNNMIAIYNLPKNKILEIRKWCSEYEGNA